MVIGIDISQLAFEETGVAKYLQNLVISLLEVDRVNKYVLFFSSLRRSLNNTFLQKIKNPNVEIKVFKFPPLFLDFIWNKIHVFPIEKLIGEIDIFISSDWTQPATIRAKKITIIYDLIPFKYSGETHNKFAFNPLKLLVSPNIVASQKRRLRWVKNEADLVFCISESTKKDAKQILGIEEKKLKVLYPGI